MKKKIFKIIQCTLFLAVVACLFRFLNYSLYNDNCYPRVMLHEMYESEPIDLVFAGASLAYRHYDPVIWDETLGVHSFNLGSSNQSPDTTYYLLKEVFREHDPKYCIYAISSLLFVDIPERDHNPLKDYIIFDYVRPSLNKAEYGIHVFKDQSELNAWMPFTRNANTNIIKTYKSVNAVKSTDHYKNYGYQVYGPQALEEYRGRGYVYREKHLEDGAVGKLDCYDISDYEADEDYLSYLDKIAALCEENNCQLIFIVAPLPYAGMRLYRDYQDSVDFGSQYIKKYGLPFFDFSLAKPALLNLPDHYFYDYTHLSGEGAEEFSRTASALVKDYLDGREIHYDKYFYSSYEELLNAAPWVYSTWMEPSEDGYTAYSTYGNGVIPYYIFYASLDGGATWRVLQEYSENNVLPGKLVPEGCNMLMVQAKDSKSQEEYQQLYRLEISGN